MSPTASIIIPLSQEEKEKLSRLALRYGFSLPEFSQRILKELASEFTRDSFKDYKKPKTLRASFARALRDYHAGRVRAKL